MVLCIIPDCGVKSGNKEGIGLFRIPIVVDKNGESYKQLTEDRRNAWISQISRDDTKSKDILKSERVCGRHFVSGKPALLWDRYNVDWKPTLNLGKKNYSKLNNIAILQDLVRSYQHLIRFPPGLRLGSDLFHFFS